MALLSDILIVFSTALDDAELRLAKSSLMDAAKSVLVHQKEGQSRVFLVKFDPLDTSPQALLSALQSVDLDASMSWG